MVGTMEVLLVLLDTLPGQPPSPPSSNLETIYASIIGIVFIFGCAWYLMFLRPDLLPSIWRGLYEDASHVRDAARADWGRTRRMLGGEELEETLKCAECGKKLVNGVIIAKGFYCTGCAMKPSNLLKAQGQFLDGKV